MRETSCLGLCHKKLLVLESGSVKTVNVGNESRRSAVERSRLAFALGSNDKHRFHLLGVHSGTCLKSWP